MWSTLQIPRHLGGLSLVVILKAASFALILNRAFPFFNIHCFTGMVISITISVGRHCNYNYQVTIIVYLLVEHLSHCVTSIYREYCSGRTWTCPSLKPCMKKWYRHTLPTVCHVRCASIYVVPCALYIQVDSALHSMSVWKECNFCVSINYINVVLKINVLSWVCRQGPGQPQDKEAWDLDWISLVHALAGPLQGVLPPSSVFSVSCYKLP